MEKSINIIANHLISEYYDLERTFEKLLRSIGMYDFRNKEIDEYDLLITEIDGNEHILQRFYLDKNDNITLEVSGSKTELKYYDYPRLATYKKILDAINQIEFENN